MRGTRRARGRRPGRDAPARHRAPRANRPGRRESAARAPVGRHGGTRRRKPRLHRATAGRPSPDRSPSIRRSSRRSRPATPTPPARGWPRTSTASATRRLHRRRLRRAACRPERPDRRVVRTRRGLAGSGLELRRSDWPSRPVRRAIISPRMATAVSSTVEEPMSSPHGAYTRAMSSSATPTSARRRLRSAVVLRLPSAPT